MLLVSWRRVRISIFFADSDIQKLRQALFQVLAADKSLETPQVKGSTDSAKLQADNDRLNAENASMRELARAVHQIQTFRPTYRQASAAPTDSSQPASNAAKACKVIARSVTARKVEGFTKDYSDSKPPAGEVLVLQATMRVLENRDSSPPWPKVEKVLSDAVEFAARFKQLDAEAISPAVLRGLATLVAKADWPSEGLGAGGLVGALRDWIQLLAEVDGGPVVAAPARSKGGRDRRRRR
mmetsp:Transcript_108171/g.248050  ORF Transcript_108171/g.248050 Transcript_108171/m.248050 type:complete len:240 (+) Transcript_108171:243-962(+)